jgi:F420-non-reducing hydrogenase iron-sulfur subunit
MALELENWERERISALISKLSLEMEKPKILVFRCQWGVFPPLDGEFTKNIRAIDLPCAARVDTLHIVEAFAKGVDGVLIIACPEEDCKRERGSREAQRSVAALRERLSQIGFQERLHFCTVAPRCVEALDEEVVQFSQIIADIGAKEAK